MPQNELAPQETGGNVLEQVIAKGDLAKLSAEERVAYYRHVCQSVGLNPFTRPLEYINLSGKLTLYARRDAADQLRKINGISVEVVSRKTEDDLCVVHVKAHDKTGRTDEDFGAVTIAKLSGEARANAILKCITKAKRRVTLSISGLGFLDETEVDDIPIRDAQPAPISAAAELDQFAASDPPHDPDTGELFEPPPRDILAEARAVALDGVDAFRDFWVSLDQHERNSIRDHLGSLEAAAKRADGKHE